MQITDLIDIYTKVYPKALATEDLYQMTPIIGFERLADLKDHLFEPDTQEFFDELLGDVPYCVPQQDGSQLVFINENGKAPLIGKGVIFLAVPKDWNEVFRRSAWYQASARIREAYQAMLFDESAHFHKLLHSDRTETDQPQPINLTDADQLPF